MAVVEGVAQPVQSHVYACHSSEFSGSVVDGHHIRDDCVLCSFVVVVWIHPLALSRGGDFLVELDFPIVVVRSPNLPVYHTRVCFLGVGFEEKPFRGIIIGDERHGTTLHVTVHSNHPSDNAEHGVGTGQILLDIP